MVIYSKGPSRKRIWDQIQVCNYGEYLSKFNIRHISPSQSEPCNIYLDKDDPLAGRIVANIFLCNTIQLRKIGKKYMLPRQV